MTGISRYEKWVLGLTAAFLLFTGGYFLAGQNRAATFEVLTGPAVPGVSSAVVEKEWPDSLLEGEVIDLNTADTYDLSRLPGIGEKRAADIAAWREEHGPFRTVEELTGVKGIGPATLDGLRDYVTVGAPTK